MKTLVRDVMTADVVTADPATRFKRLVALLTDQRISALPVTDERGHVVGIVSAADLLLKEEEPQAPPTFPLAERKSRRVERRKQAAAVAGELMTVPAVTVPATATVAEAARRMHARRVKRLPVVDPVGRLVGIVSRTDLLRVFTRPDEDIRREVEQEVIARDFAMSPKRFQVEVTDGAVTLSGAVERCSLIPYLIRAVRSVDGVVAVQDRLGFDLDDLEPRPMTYPWLRPVP